jgi:hypothetical protein
MLLTLLVEVSKRGACCNAVHSGPAASCQHHMLAAKKVLQGRTAAHKHVTTMCEDNRSLADNVNIA